MDIVGGLEVIQKINEKSNTHIVFFHGYGANANDLFSLREFLDPGSKYNWHFPNGFLSLGVTPMYDSRAWFPIDIEAYEKAQAKGEFRDMASTRPAGLNEARDRVLKFLKEILKNGDKLILGGFSQGAMLSAEISSQLSSVLSGLIILSGAFVDESNWVPSFTKLSGLPFIQSHGNADPILSFDEAKRLYDCLIKQGLKGDFLDFAGGHEIPVGVVLKAKEFIQANA